MAMINQIQTGSFEGGLSAADGGIEKTAQDFRNTLEKAIQDINELQKEAETMTELFVQGDITDLHQVMVAGQKARLGLELLLEVRNRLFEGYQEIMRMQL